MASVKKENLKMIDNDRLCIENIRDFCLPNLSIWTNLAIMHFI